MRIFLDIVGALIGIGIVAMVIVALFFRSFDGDYDPKKDS